MKVVLTKTFEAEYCTHEFLKDGKHLANHVWAIAKYEDGNYAIVHKITNEIGKEFKEKKKIYDNTWLLTLLDETQCIMYYDEDKIKVSNPFLNAIYIFENFVLIENLEGKRKILRKKDFSKELSWFDGSADDYKILRLPDGDLTILRKQGLEVLDIDFDDYLFDSTVDNAVIIMRNEQYRLVRISDFEMSIYYDEMAPYNESRKSTNRIEYVIVTYYPNKEKAIIRVENFKVSKSFDDIKPINYEYALVTSNNKQEILRLSDYKVAKFE